MKSPFMKLFVSSLQIKSALGGFVLTSLIVGFLCISFIHAMPIHGNTGSHTSHQASQTTLNACCDVGVSDHMELWKSTLVGIPQSFQDILALLVIGVAAAFVFSDFFATPKPNLNILALRYKQYAREHPNIHTYDPLKLAFARGILHPKTF